MTESVVAALLFLGGLPLAPQIVVSGTVRVQGALSVGTSAPSGQSMDFSTTAARAQQIRSYGAAMFPETTPFGVVQSDAVDSGGTVTEPFRVIQGGVTIQPVRPRPATGPPHTNQ